MEFLRRTRGIHILIRALRGRRDLQWSLRGLRQPLHLQLRANSTLPESQPTANIPASTGVRLRDYQKECIQAVLSYVSQGHKRLGISLATGAGKTVIFTQLIDYILPPNSTALQTLIIVHRRELVEQAARHCRLAYPDRTVEIEMGNSKASGRADITIASIQSLVSKDRMEKFDPARFKLVLVDEAHHIVAASYRKALAHFGLDSLSDNSPILVGVSATFSRFDGLKLGAAIDQIVFHKDYIDMIDENWLADAVFTTVRSEADLSKVKKDKFGDFAVGPLSEAVNTELTNNITVRAWLANAHERKSTLVFCVDIAHVRGLTDTFRAHGIDARFITATTPKETRAEELRAFKEGEYPVLLNCGLFTEGTDIPNIDCVLLARPTRSKNLLIQMIGRGLRLYPGKKDCHVIDMVASLRTGVLSTPTLFGLHPDEVLDKSSGKDLSESPNRVLFNNDREMTAVEEGTRNEPEDVSLTFTKYDSVFDLLSDSISEQHIRSISPHAWVRIGPDKYILSESAGWITIERETENEPTSKSTNKSTDPDPNSFAVRLVLKYHDPTGGESKHTRPRVIARGADLEAAVHAADTFASKRFQSHRISTRLPWRKAPATAAQLKLLNKAHIRPAADLAAGEINRGQAADMITKLKFGGKKQFGEMEAQKRLRERQQAKVRDFEELKRRTDVRVGPLLT
ncbi:hypothetical protein ASPZODRAFT_151615 [Penicilliopsis zonata CBS 506.65]|uniref:Helicase ATP-binding domain-containing protein n=1 Tax=Penicilliopsis zonata CBS 506.65 TaxID=1073090 RepID=A0A1L9SIL8_9EURO|nr:hypothetical protein ASPZODRAFT_151615 [Penicilliopsis zonata CBS 506.65]OJJ47038.1 hypothetical protein ASPZODRAFT_151615 [Penicilliopsis zonata CBS 506.65]